MNWEDYRRFDRSLDLVSAFDALYPDNHTQEAAAARSFLTKVSCIYPISSRQAAAIALATAEFIVLRGLP